MDAQLTSVPWLNVIELGFLFGIGWIVAQAIYSAVLWVLGQRRPPPQG